MTLSRAAPLRLPVPRVRKACATVTPFLRHPYQDRTISQSSAVTQVEALAAWWYHLLAQFHDLRNHQLALTA